LRSAIPDLLSRNTSSLILVIANWPQAARVNFTWIVRADFPEVGEAWEEDIFYWNLSERADTRNLSLIIL